MDTDPVFYKKFSQLLKETIAAYEQGRIDELEYLKRVLKYKEDILAHTDNELPEELQQNNAAKAYYGLALETYQRIFDDAQVDLKKLALETAMTFDGIINRTLIVDGSVLVDWQQKSDIIGRMKIELEDYLIDDVKRKYGLDFSFDDMDIKDDANTITCPHCGGKIHFDGEPHMPEHKNIRGKEYYK
jgi:type I restriction enzyme R subunit